MGVKLGLLKLKGEHRLRVFDNRILRRISDLRRDDKQENGEDTARYIYIYIYILNLQIGNFMNTVRWEPSCSFRTDGRTDRQTSKLIFAFKFNTHGSVHRSMT